MGKKGKKKRSLFKRFMLFILLVLFIIFIIFMLGTYVFETKVKTIVVHDNMILNDKDIIEIANLENYPNFYKISITNTEKKLKNNEYVKDVEVKKNLLFEVHIYVDEYKPLFIREDTNKIVFDTGKEINNTNTYNLNIPSLVNYVPDTKYKNLIKKMDSIDYEIVSKISDIKYDPNKYDEDRFILYMNDSNRVYINLPKFKNLNKYDEMVTKFEGKTGTLYLDSGNYFEID